jgi:hypothetical protein
MRISHTNSTSSCISSSSADQHSDLQRADQHSDLQRADQHSDLQRADQHSDLQRADQHSDLQRADNHACESIHHHRATVVCRADQPAGSHAHVKERDHAFVGDECV